EPADEIGTCTAIEPCTAHVNRAPGAYVVIVETPGHVTVRAPVLVERKPVRSHEIVLDIAPPRLENMPHDYNLVFVPAGDFLFGEADETNRVLFFGTTPLRPRRTPAFLIGKHEVTFAEWIEYLDALPVAEQAARLPL